MIAFSAQEGETIAAAKGCADVDEFHRVYCRTEDDGSWGLKELWNPKLESHDCIMLDRTSAPGKAICSLYSVRPVQCRTWPFWPENLENREAWDGLKEECPGIDKVRGGWSGGCHCCHCHSGAVVVCRG